MFKKLIKSQVLRKRLSWVIFIILVLPFVLFFSPAQLNRANGAAGMLFGKKVSREDFDRQQRWIRRQLEQQPGEPLPEPVITQLTWERLMLLAHAQRQRVKVPDAELARVIHQIPHFQVDGRFQPERYRLFLHALNISPQSFEEMIRDDLRIQRLVSQVRAAVIVTDPELEEAYRTAHERARVSLVAVPSAAFAGEAAQQISEADVQAAYEAQQESLRLPEQVAFEYLGLTEAEARAQAAPAQEDLDRYYAAHPDEFTTDSTVQLPEQVQENVRARVAAEQAKQRLVGLAMDLDEQRAKTFEELAAAANLAVRSFGPTPAGDLFVAGAPEPALMQVAFTQPIGELSRVVETDQGVYVLRVTAREPSRVPPLEEVRPKVLARLTETRALELARQAASALHERLTQALASGTPFEEACRQAQTTPVSPAPFARSQAIDALGDAPQVNAEVFETAAGELTGIVQTQDRFVIALVRERLPADLGGLAAEREPLREETLQRKQQERLIAWLADLRERAKLQSYVSP
ncbi:MAG: peptidyl-prolyl cis-trans isomerase [Candidatus Omnitrophica bacterium]|nr:peptidyl-prolyl cis-trans isomerase [Candidatus Omnitrophota bacterium]